MSCGRPSGRNSPETVPSANFFTSPVGWLMLAIASPIARRAGLRPANTARAGGGWFKASSVESTLKFVNASAAPPDTWTASGLTAPLPQAVASRNHRLVMLTAAACVEMQWFAVSR